MLRSWWERVLIDAIKAAGLDSVVYGNCARCGKEDFLHPTEKLCRVCYLKMEVAAKWR